MSKSYPFGATKFYDLRDLDKMQPLDVIELEDAQQVKLLCDSAKETGKRLSVTYMPMRKVWVAYLRVK